MSFARHVLWMIRDVIWTMRLPPYREAPVRFMFHAVRHMWKEKLAGKDGKVRFTACRGRIFESPINNFSAFAAATFDERDLNITRYWPRVLRTGSIFFDVGANIGLYCISASRHVGADGQVVGFEAHPTIYRYLETNVARNGIENIAVENLAVGAENGRIRIAFSARNPGETHVAAGSEQGVSVPLVTLDDYCAGNGIERIDYLKIDVEGYETHVINGAAAIIAASESILIQTEYEPRHLQRYGSSTELVNLLRNWGFRPHTIAWDGAAWPLDSFDKYRGGEIVWSRVDLGRTRDS
jgi:FkbM family methyltransferase